MSHPAGPANGQPELLRVMGLRDVVLFNITAIVGLRWLTTAASQFGFASLLLWAVAMLIFFVPLAIAVRELAEIDPAAGGIYKWVQRAFGARPGFVAGWGYWVSNLLYFPALLVSTAAIAAYVGGPSTVHLGDDGRFIAVVALAGLAIAVWLNVVGLNIGKWLPNLGAYGTWIPLAIFLVLAVWSFTRHGSATPFAAGDLIPKSFGFQSINLFGTLLFAFGGLATAALTERLGYSTLAPVAAVVALLLALGNVGGVSAWLSGVARVPYAAGLDRVLPPWFSRVHPKWRTPYVSLLVQGGFAAVFVVASLVGTTVKNAYLVLTQATLVLFFIPYLFMFAAYLKLRRERTTATTLAGWSGLVAVAFAIFLAFVPPEGEDPVLYEVKVGGGVAAFMLIGWWLAARRLPAGR